MLSSNLVEAANRAEATALLIRTGYKVYRPEADTNGEDLIVRTPEGVLKAVQLKSRVYVDRTRYFGNDLNLLLPSGPYVRGSDRNWYLVPHDELYAYVEQRHSRAPTWAGVWSYSYLPAHLKNFLSGYTVPISSI